MNFHNKYWDTAKKNLDTAYRGQNVKISKTELFEKWFISQNIAFSKNWNTLDIGAGTGRWALWIAPKVKKTTCIDFSAEMLKHVRQKSIEQKINNILFIKSDINDWKPEKEEYYDFVIISGILELIDEAGCGNLINKISRVLKNNGKLLFRDHIAGKPFIKNNFVFFRDKKFYSDLFLMSGLKLVKESFTISFLSEIFFNKPFTKIFIWKKTRTS
ncbi:MAG: class I SAM-dependent methyltransferase [bacterium]